MPGSSQGDSETFNSSSGAKEPLRPGAPSHHSPFLFAIYLRDNVPAIIEGRMLVILALIADVGGGRLDRQCDRLTIT
jgi:hypothetical protein